MKLDELNEKFKQIKNKEKEKDMKLDELNEKFKQIKNKADFDNLVKEVNSNSCWFEMKHSGHSAFSFDFHQYRFNNEIITEEEYCSYLIDDGVSRGKSKWENLYKKIKITN